MSTKPALKASQEAQDAHEAAKVGGDRLADLVTPERLRKGDEFRATETRQAGRREFRVDTQRCLDRYLKRSHISYDQYLAGDRLFKDWKSAGASLDAAIGQYEHTGSRSNQPPGPPAAVIAMERLERARRWIGPELWSVLVTVCLADRSASDWAYAREVARDSGMVVLKLALDRLAAHYRWLDGKGGKRKHG